jgi:predicted nucleic acid-binding protein/tetratricopeptide (TPR) repeat protein
MARAFVIDSNFYISVSRTRIEGALEELINWSREGHGELHTSVRVLEEIRTVPNYGTKATMVELVEKHFKVHQVATEKIVALQRLIGVSAAPQDTDLSLMALSAELTAQGHATTLVTDDFKITKTAPKIPQHFEVISPSVFLLQVSNDCTGNRKVRFKDLHRKVRRFEIEYMLSRRDIYDAQPKLDWLIDSMIGSLANVSPEGSAAPAPAPVPLVPDAAPGEEGDDVQALERYLRGERVRPSKLKAFEHLLPFTNTLRDLDHVRREVAKLAGEGKTQKALEALDRRLNGMKTELQVGFASIPPRDADLLYKTFSPKLADLQYIAAMIHLSLGEMDQGEARLNDTALLGLFAENGGIALEANYLLSLIYLYQLEYEQASGQFALVDLLAQRLMREDARTRALVGKALAEFLRGESAEASAAMVDVYHAIEKDPKAGVQVLEDFGDHLANFSLPQIAVDFYEEAMECAAEVDDHEALERLVTKAKRSHFATGRSVGEVAKKISELVNRAHEFKSVEARARFDAEKANLLQMVETMQGPLPYTTKDWTSGGDLPHELRERMEVSSVVQNRKLDGGFETVAIAYAPSLGKIAVFLPPQLADQDISRAGLQLNESGHFKVLPAPKELADVHEARAIIGGQGSNDIKIDRVAGIASFFVRAPPEK